MEIICPTLTTYEIELPEQESHAQPSVTHAQPLLQLASVQPDASQRPVDIQLIESSLARYFNAD